MVDPKAIERLRAFQLAHRRTFGQCAFYMQITGAAMRVSDIDAVLAAAEAAQNAPHDSLCGINDANAKADAQCDCWKAAPPAEGGGQ